MPPGIVVDPAGRLACDRPCLQCGHNLRGLAADGVCGECGLAVVVSLSGHPLAGAPPKWLGTLRAGATKILLVYPWLWLPLAWPLAWAGCWHLAAPHPTRAGHGEGPAIAARVLLILQACAALAFAALTMVEPSLREFSYLAAAILGGAAAILLATTLAAARVSTRGGSKRFRALVGWLILAWVLGPPAVGVAIVIENIPATPNILEALALCLVIIGGPLLAAIPVLTWCVAHLAWRELEYAETLGGPDQARITVWVARASAALPMATPEPAATGTRTDPG